MGVRFDSTVQSLFGQRQTARAANRLNAGLEGLASGLRINRAADDAAGLAIAERFRAEVRQLNQEVNIFQTGVNLTQTADSALEGQAEAVGRIRELAVQAANGILTDDQRAALNEEAQQLRQGIEDIAQNTEFNGTALLNGTTGTVDLNADATVQIDLPDTTEANLGTDTVDLSTQEGAANALDALDTAATRIDQARANLGAQENRLVRAIEVREEQAVNQTEAESRIRDLDIARASIDQARNRVLMEGGMAALVQGNLQGQTALRLLGG